MAAQDSLQKKASLHFTVSTELYLHLQSNDGHGTKILQEKCLCTYMCLCLLLFLYDSLYQVIDGSNLRLFAP